MKPFTRVAGSCLLAVALVTSVLAQPQRVTPHLGFVYPAGGKQGATFSVSVGGQNLVGTTTAYVSGPGVRARVVSYDRPLSQKEINDLREKAQVLQDKRQAARNDPKKPPFTAEDEKKAAEIRETLAKRSNRQANPALAETVTLEITLAPDAVMGERELRLKAPNGLSNPLVFCVGQLPEVGEEVVTATSGRGNVRNRTSDPRNGRTKTEMEISPPTVVNGQILPGEVDRYRFTAKRGQRLVVAVNARALIPYLADAVPGWFQATVAVLDAKGREIAYDDDFQFNPDPALGIEIPEDGAYSIEIKDAIYRGREDFVYRITVGELPFVTSIFPLGGKVAGQAAFDLTGWNLANEKILMDTKERGTGRFVLAVRNQGVLSNPIKIALDADPECFASESAGGNSTPQPVSLPVIVNGRIDRAGDEDSFVFEAKAGAAFVAEVFARRLGSPLDSILTLTDASGRQLAINDDFDDKGAGLLTHQADSRITFTLPADGAYTVKLGDAQRHGGPEYGYRLRLGLAEPNFELRVVPSSLSIRSGASVPITVYALRRDGFTGEILVGIKDAPRGFFLSGGRIPPGEDSVKMTLTALSTPRDEPYDLTVVGLTTIGGRQVAHTAVPADDMMQAFAYHHLVTAKELKVDVSGRGTSMRVQSKMPVQIPAGGTARVRIATYAARPYDTAHFELIDAPAGVTVKSSSSGSDYVDVVLACDAAKAKAGQQGNLMLNAFGERRGAAQKKTSAAQRSSFGVVPAIPFEIVASGKPPT